MSSLTFKFGLGGTTEFPAALFDKTPDNNSGSEDSDESEESDDSESSDEEEQTIVGRYAPQGSLLNPYVCFPARVLVLAGVALSWGGTANVCS